MIVAGSTNPLLLASAAGEYNLTNSLRFRSSASAYLNRTFASGGNLRTWTWSAWVKRGALNADQQLFGWWEFGGSYNNQHWIGFTSNNDIEYKLYDGQTNTHIGRKITTQVFRDPSAWYHLVFVWDTTNATASSRMRIYVNGSQVTSFSTSTDPSQNTDGYVNLTSPNALHTLGAVFDSSYSSSPLNVFDGYMTEINFIDGQALTASSFGETSATTGVWQPIEYAGTYGTTGFYLPFTDNSALTTSSNAGLGKDFSGNGNYWTTNNISITSGSTYDSMTDVPTLTDESTANYCVMNPLWKNTNHTVSNGNLTVTSSSYGSCGSTLGVSSGKWYYEATISNRTTNNSGAIGYCNESFVISSSTFFPDTTNGFGVLAYDGRAYSGSGTAYGSAFSSGDIIMVAFDADAKQMWVGKNGTWFNSGNPVTAANPFPLAITGTTFFPCVNCFGDTYQFNFGAGSGFAYTPPTGYVALNTYNLPTPTIGATASSQAGKYFNAVLWTGDATDTRTISGVGFQPDLVWFKDRTSAYDNMLYDSVRGAGNVNALYSNTTAAQGGGDELTYGYLSSFASDGFGVTAGAAGAPQKYFLVNKSGDAYVAWNWKANGSGSSNTAGSITSTVSANTSSGFSIVTYTGNGSSGATVGHGLGVAPRMIIVQTRTGTNNKDKPVYHTSIGNTGAVFLNKTNATDTWAGYWNNTSPSSTLITLGNDQNTNQSSSTYVAYCFSEVAGFSKFGSFTANNSSDGNFIYLGFRPRWIMCKQTSGSGGAWFILDTARNTYNVMNNILDANSSGAERNDNIWDATANGMKLRIALSGDFIYAAFAETPTKFALAR